jgi:ADP-ribose pyrophosphatase
MIRNHRVAVGSRLLELCAGKLEPGEDPIESAGRELEEETGFSAASLVPLGRFYTSPGFTNELMHVFEATDLTPVPRRLEPGEDIEVVLRTREEVEEAIRSGALCDGKTIAAFHLWCLGSTKDSDVVE